jgi:hypothetical protein
VHDVDDRTLGGGVRDPGAAIINAKKHRRQPRGRCCRRIWVRTPPTLENINNGPPGRCSRRIHERPPPTLENIYGGGSGRCCRKIRKHPPPTLENVDDGPLGSGAGDPGASTINAKKCQWRAPSEVLTETLRAPTINTRKHRRRAPWEVLPENPRAPTTNARKHQQRPLGRCCRRIWERPPPMLENVTAGPLAGADGDLRAPTINARKRR